MITAISIRFRLFFCATMSFCPQNTKLSTVALLYAYIIIDYNCKLAYFT